MPDSHKTAMARKSASAPMRRLATDGRLVGRTLDYGCGKGRDASIYRTDLYDPHYQPDMPNGLYKTIVCNYVLNVIKSADERVRVMKDIQSRLWNDGTAYITVRNDTRALRGRTATGTWQALIVLRLPVVYKSAGYITYALTTNDQVSKSTQEARTF